jgi:hypothetical protein
VGCNQRTAEIPAAEPSAAEPDIIVEEVQFRHGDDLLAGSLYRPDLPGRRPGLALVYGSDAHDRRYGGVGPALGRQFTRKGLLSA